MSVIPQLKKNKTWILPKRFHETPAHGNFS